jgi:hypothetical protein
MSIMNLPQRFHDKYEVNPDTGCWEWTGGSNHAGYGRFSLNGKLVAAHRYVYAIANDLDLTDLAGLVVCHSCDNPRCVNPAHLNAGTQTDNMNDMVQKGRGPVQVLDVKQVRAIKEMLRRHQYGAGRFLSRWFGVSFQHISRINTGEKWANA